jgi:hypothetical protein
VNPAPAAAAGSSRHGRLPFRPIAFAIAAITLLFSIPDPADAGGRSRFLRLRVERERMMQSAEPDSGSPDLIFMPADGDSFGAGEEPVFVHGGDDDKWLRAPFGDNLLTDRDAWRHGHRPDGDLEVDYNRVDRLRLSARAEWQGPDRMAPRLGTRFGYTFDRKRTVYGVQLEQPVVPPGRISVGVSMVRRTDHYDTQQVDDFENALALLLFRRDFRDYFEREGFGAYLSWRVPDFSTVSVHFRNDEYRSLPTEWGTRSWLNRRDPLRENPAIDEGEIHAIQFRLERLAHHTHLTRAGFYHWIELERAGYGLEGDFEYTRLLADGRSVFRLSPATTFSLRGVAGSALDGVVPRQKWFTLGGVDGLRAHEFGEFLGTQLALGQAEYSLSLWQLDRGGLETGLQALAFLDVGKAWPNDGWDLDRQNLEVDGGFGIATEDDGLRLYFARNLQDSNADLVVSLRLQRPF